MNKPGHARRKKRDCSASPVLRKQALQLVLPFICVGKTMYTYVYAGMRNNIFKIYFKKNVSEDIQLINNNIHFHHNN